MERGRGSADFYAGGEGESRSQNVDGSSDGARAVHGLDEARQGVGEAVDDTFARGPSVLCHSKDRAVREQDRGRVRSITRWGTETIKGCIRPAGRQAEDNAVAKLTSPDGRAIEIAITAGD